MMINFSIRMRNLIKAIGGVVRKWQETEETFVPIVKHILQLEDDNHTGIIQESKTGS